LIRKEDLSRVWAFMGEVLKTRDCQPLTIGGTSNHVHCLFVLSKTKALSEIVNALKSITSKWIGEIDSDYYVDFSWQGGYGAFSISSDRVPNVQNYIANQETHHNKKTFEEELKELYDSMGIKYDECYLWTD